MTDWDDRDFSPVEDDGVLQPADSLESDRLGDDPLDTGLTTSGGYRGATAYGTTPAEGNQGESLDQLLAAEEPDEPPDAVDDRWSDGPRPGPGGWCPARTTRWPRTSAGTAGRPAPRRRPSM